MSSVSTFKRVLFLVGQELGITPGQRFRFEQYIDHFNRNGIKCDISPLLSKADTKTLYSQGNLAKKAFLIKKAIEKRNKDLSEIKNGLYDAVFIYRDALMIRSTYFEQKIHKTGIPMILDFDDSIWLTDVSDANKMFKWLKNPSKTSKIIGLCNQIIVGNDYLNEYALQFNKNTTIIPTTIDTDLYSKKTMIQKNNDKVTIGWSGSITTLKHFKTSLVVLETLKKKYGDSIKISIIGDGNYNNQELGINGKWWNAETELDDLLEFDIGIMPLPNDLWSKGKCGLKGLQYMALEIPTIMSSVGVNKKIIDDGINGFLADSHDEWVEKLSLLIESADLRKKLGEYGRLTTVEKYSVDANKDKWLKTFQNVLNINA